MRKLLYAAVVAGLGVAAMLAPSVAPRADIALLTGPQDPSQLNATINSLIQSINSGITPQTMSLFSGARNYVDNGSMAIQQRGTGLVTCGTTTIPPATAYGADRWGCNANVTSGAGRMQPVTTGPTPPAGFAGSQILYRLSGALTQPVCAWQEITSGRSVQLQGQTVVFSAYVQALAGLAADNGSAANLVIVYGTGSDQGLQTFTASPAITPAWTGITTLTNTAIAPTTAWVRYQTPPVQMPTTATEIGVALCFTPTAAGAGATDGFAFTGVQLEAGNSAGPYEFRGLGTQLETNQQFFYSLTEGASAGTVQSSGSGQGATTTTCQLYFAFPSTMRAAPTFNALGTALSASTWTVTHVATATTLGTPYLAVLGANTVSGASMTATASSAALTTGQTCTLTSANGGSILSWTADF